MRHLRHLNIGGGDTNFKRHKRHKCHKMSKLELF